MKQKKILYTCPCALYSVDQHGHALRIWKSQICCGQMLRQRWQFQDWEILWRGLQIWVRQDSAVAVITQRTYTYSLTPVLCLHIQIHLWMMCLRQKLPQIFSAGAVPSLTMTA